ncbi:sensor histidine kinase, HAMP domain-containing [Geotalea daltonii FRC-32]|uniref:histidine kinase n=1 Tax=Geotalea daltonii (strain DSM 22248 / JCM 15807 / FRC-32) TaxID=316067 RepID=B9M609_GEODF|nr:cache domain-containing protein [Geotalea daltonii]ACM19990.1 sensor histidine kinase, HAMP domain-containing [Geotalea daltonii FRC-32]
MPQQKRFSIKRKLSIAILIPIAVAILICWLAGVFILNTRVVRQAQEKVRNDLNAAREVYLHEVGHIRDVVRFTASAPYTAAALHGNREVLAGILAPLRQTEQLDLFMALDAQGRVLYRANNPAASSDDKSRNPVITRALKGEIIAGTWIVSAEAMAMEGNQLAEQATIPILSTPHARPTTETMERAGMMLIAAAPVRDGAGRIIGALCGGVLLNKNNSLVDKIKSIVYEGVKADGKDVGSATIFLGDLRIATNVLTSGGSRAIGTRLSEEVYNRVILHKEKWIDRAFVVNDWYFTAYEPILSVDGVPLGSLYVGMLEKPYTAIKFRLGLLFSGVLLVGAVIGIAVAGWLAARLAKPVKELENAARRVAAGERDVQCLISSRDELGDLAEEFNQMNRALMQREDDIRELNRGLENKVRERTAELEEKNRLLVKAREELVRAEKLAAIGELAAGVAHEINNPMAIIRGNTELLQMSVPEGADNRDEVDTIYQQVGRVERIVGNLLRFARQEKKQLGHVRVNELMEEILAQIVHQVPLSHIRIIKEYEPGLPILEGDSEQIRQVLTNLVLNAIQAMDKGGILTVRTQLDRQREQTEIMIADTGTGIEADNLQQIFNPFFTTKANGTGLGLSVSYGIVNDHGGTIRVESKAGKGSTFKVSLPIKGRF